MVLSWDAPSLDQQNGQIISYIVNFEGIQILIADDGTTLTRGQVNFNRIYPASQNRTQVIDDLLPYHNYTVRIAAATRLGESSYSSPYIATTHDGSKLIVQKISLLYVLFQRHLINCNIYSIYFFYFLVQSII